LRHAIGTKQFHMDFQPVVDLKTSRVTSVEALMRWQHPEMGLVPPGRFIPVAERSGLILALGQFAIEQVLRQMRAWLDAGVNCVPVAINVAPQQLERTDFVALVTELTTKSGIEPRWLRFEITESALLQNTDKLVGTLQQLRQLGVQILIDDFGTGYSGLSYLTQLPVDTIKIDRSFVVDPAHNGGDSPIITAILDMARKLGLVTIAEGVETREQALRLRRQGCDFAQGYFFSKPLSPRRCRRLLEKLRLRDQQRERPKLAVAS
jgi:EAL domain-containing protein (putative c-di-GMP-specific phosphodiesterase class I)